MADSKEKTPCANVEINQENCSCTSKDCPRRGFCCECIAAHRAKDQVPACLRHLLA